MKSKEKLKVMVMAAGMVIITHRAHPSNAKDVFCLSNLTAVPNNSVFCGRNNLKLTMNNVLQT